MQDRGIIHMQTFNFKLVDGTSVTSSFNIVPISFPKVSGSYIVNGDPFSSSVAPASFDLVPNTFKVELNRLASNNWYVSSSTNTVTASSAIVSGSYSTGSLCQVTFNNMANNRSLDAYKTMSIKPASKNVGFNDSFILEDTVYATTNQTGSLTVSLVPQAYTVNYYGGVRTEKYTILVPASASVNAKDCIVTSNKVASVITPQNQANYGYTAQVSDARYLSNATVVSSSVSASYSGTASVLLGSVQSASFASTASNAILATTSIFATTSGNASVASAINFVPTVAISASYASQSLSASFATIAGTANAISFVPSVSVSASYASRSLNSDTASFVTGSNVKGMVPSSSLAITATQLENRGVGGASISTSGNNGFNINDADGSTTGITGGGISIIYNFTSSLPPFRLNDVNNHPVARIDGNGNYVTIGYVSASSANLGAITGSLNGTASWANNAVQSNTAVSATTATFATSAGTAAVASAINFVPTVAVSASAASSSISASFATNAVTSNTASYLVTSNYYTASGLNIIGANQVTSTTRLGSLEVQPYASANNLLLMENMYYSGSFFYRQNGGGTVIQFLSGEIEIGSQPRGGANNTGSAYNIQAKITNSGSVAIGGAMNGVAGDFTGASAVFGASSVTINKPITASVISASLIGNASTATVALTAGNAATASYLVTTNNYTVSNLSASTANVSGVSVNALGQLSVQNAGVFDNNTFYAATFGNAINIKGGSAGFQIADRANNSHAWQHYADRDFFRIWNTTPNEFLVMSYATGKVGLNLPSSSIVNQLDVGGNISCSVITASLNGTASFAKSSSIARSSTSASMLSSGSAVMQYDANQNIFYTTVPFEAEGGIWDGANGIVAIVTDDQHALYDSSGNAMLDFSSLGFGSMFGNWTIFNGGITGSLYGTATTASCLSSSGTITIQSGNNTVELRNTGSAQRLNIYGASTSTSSFTRLSLYGSGNDVVIDSNPQGSASGSGDLIIRHSANHSIKFLTNGTQRWSMASNGDWLPSSTSTNIGQNGLGINNLWVTNVSASNINTNFVSNQSASLMLTGSTVKLVRSATVDNCLIWGFENTASVSQNFYVKAGMTHPDVTRWGFYPCDITGSTDSSWGFALTNNFYTLLQGYQNNGSFGIDPSGVVSIYGNGGINFNNDITVNGNSSFNSSAFIDGNLEVSGKITGDGGVDPAYVLYDRNTRAVTKARVLVEVPIAKQTGAAMFFNSDTKLMEIFIPSEDTWYDLQGNLLAASGSIEADTEGYLSQVSASKAARNS